MNTTDKIAIAALVVSVLGFVYTVILNWRQGNYIKTQHELNKLALAKEQELAKRKDYAEITVRTYKVDSQHWKIKIANIGEGVAKNLSYSFVGEAQWEMLNGDLFPLPVLDSKASVELKPLIYMGTPDKCTIKMVWEDGRGKVNKDFLLAI